MPPKTTKISSNKFLLIVESSSKCSKIESYLGDNYKCIACNGHMRMIGGLKSIDAKRDYAITFDIDPDKKAHVDKMRGIIAGYPKENVILASDHDREGEAIAWHICDIFDLPVATTRRIIFHEITKPALLAAVANPRTIDMNMVQAQQARQVLDMLVGFKISPLLWKHICSGKNSSLSAGRCQTPALRLVYENEMEAKKSAADRGLKHRVQAAFFSQDYLFELNKEMNSYEEIETFLEKSKLHKHELSIGKMRESVKSPPKPFNTATLLQAASNAFGMGSKDVMACCQTLYQLGHITYMRTDSRKYSPVFTEIAGKYIEEKWTKKHVNIESVVNIEGTSEAHEAIRVTNIAMHEIVLGQEKLEKVYMMIWRNTIQSCMSAATFNCLPLEITAPVIPLFAEGNQVLAYKHTIETPKFGGFLDIIKTDNKTAKEIEQNNLFFSETILRLQYVKDKTIPYNYIKTIVGFTNRHSRYTEASLIDNLDEIGIGRPSTFSMLADVIQTRNYVEKTDVKGEEVECREYGLKDGIMTKTAIKKMMGAEHKKLVINPMGIAVTEFLLKHFSNFFSYDYTKNMEARLDAVAGGKELGHRLCEESDRELDKLIKKLDGLEKKSYPIGEDHLLIYGKNGMILKHKIDKTEDGKPVFKSVKKGMKIDMEKLERGEYSLEDLAESEDRILGIHEDAPVYLKMGKFGLYLEHKETKASVKKGIAMETIEDAIKLLDSATETSSAILRELTPDLSIRKGKFGPYIFYKTKTMKKPKFLDLRNFEQGFGTCEKTDLIKWIEETHHIKVKIAKELK
jgi:DNA topoisomerase-1